MWNAEKIYYQGSSGYTRAYQGTELVWERPVQNAYIIFTAKQANSSVNLKQEGQNHTIQYSTDGTNWSNMVSGTTISLANSGDSVYVRGLLTNVLPETIFGGSGNIKLSGNLNALWDYNNLNAPLKNMCGAFLFESFTALSDASELVLPATALTIDCYADMFYGCSNLVSAPALPATKLADSCYAAMFAGCSSLTSAPALPATNLEYCPSCYRAMFADCTSLTTAPVLRAELMTIGCYSYMFSGCTNLNYIKCLATNIRISTPLTTRDWVAGVAPTGTFVKKSSISGWESGSNGIPVGWMVREANY